MSGVAIVTGASGGIEAAVVATLEHAGLLVSGWDRDAAPRPIDRIVDVTDAHAIEHALDDVESELGPVEVLVSCAGGAESPARARDHRRRVGAHVRRQHYGRLPDLHRRRAADPREQARSSTGWETWTSRNASSPSARNAASPNSHFPTK